MTCLHFRAANSRQRPPECNMELVIAPRSRSGGLQVADLLSSSLAWRGFTTEPR